MDPLQPLIDSLAAEGRLRVWSLVITVFGDAVQIRGGRIATARLQRLLERLGVGNGALRTALSRLAADGWVERDRAGRNSFYRLSARGLAEFAPATGRIYAPPRVGPVRDWMLGVGGTVPAAALALGGGAWLCPAGAARPGPDTLAAVAGPLATAPEALAERVLGADHRAALVQLAADIAALPARPDPLTAMAARTLLVHRWRRIVLRFPDLPDELLPAALPLPGPRARVAAAYAALLAASEAWLDAGDAGFPAMPPADAAMVRRFRAPE